jgi:flagellar motor protein MotB
MSFGINRKNIKRFEEADSEGTWAISYGDMVTLLLAFFVLFFTINPNEERQQQLQQSLLMDLKKSSLIDREISSEASEGKENKKANVTIGSEEAPNNIDPKLLEKWKGKVYKSGDKIIIDFPNVSFYELGFIDLNSEGRKTLEEFVKVYMPYAGNYMLGIRAFTDTRKVVYKRRYRDNLELSALRSVSAMRVLRDLGIPLSRMRLGGYGELQMTYDKLNELNKDYQLKDLLSFARKIVLVIEPEDKPEEPS